MIADNSVATSFRVTKSSRFEQKPHILVVLAAVWLLAQAIVSSSSAQQFSPGDEVEVLRKTPLLFNGKPVEDARQGERLNIIAFRPTENRVYVLRVKNGQKIAVSLETDSVALVPLRKRALEAVRAGKLQEAVSLIHQARQAEPTGPDLVQMETVLRDALSASAELTTAKATAARATAEALRIEKNAAVTDRPNLLVRGDDSNQRRAEAMREQAKGLRESGSKALETATAGYGKAMAALNASAASVRIGPAPSNPEFPPRPQATAENAKVPAEFEDTTLQRLALQLAPKGMRDPRTAHEFVVNATLHLDATDFSLQEKREVVSRICGAMDGLKVESSEILALWKILGALWKTSAGIELARVVIPHVLAVLEDPELSQIANANIAKEEKPKASLLLIAILKTMGQAALLKAESFVVSAAVEYSILEPSNRRATVINSGATLDTLILGEGGLKARMIKDDIECFSSFKDIFAESTNNFGTALREYVFRRKTKLEPEDYATACRILPFDRVRNAAHQAEAYYLANRLISLELLSVDTIQELGGSNSLSEVLSQWRWNKAVYLDDANEGRESILRLLPGTVTSEKRRTIADEILRAVPAFYDRLNSSTQGDP